MKRRLRGGRAAAAGRAFVLLAAVSLTAVTPAMVAAAEHHPSNAPADDAAPTMAGAAEHETPSTEPAAAASAEGRRVGPGLQLHVDLEQRAGIAYDWAWELGRSATASGLGLRGGLGWNDSAWYLPDTWQAGVSLALTGLGTQADLVLGLWWTRRVAEEARWSGGPGVLFAPGLALFRQAPLAVWTGQLLYRVHFRVTPHLGLEGSAGIGWSVSPAFGREVSPYRVVDLPLRLTMVWRF